MSRVIIPVMSSRRPARLAFLALLMALPFTLPAGAGEPKAQAPANDDQDVAVDDPKLQKSIEDCIRRGVNWLKGRQLPSGAWTGLDQGTPYGGGSGKTYEYQIEITGLTLLALLKCDVSPKELCIVKGFEWLRKQSQQLPSYGPAICLMALEAKYLGKEAVSKKNSKPRAGKKLKTFTPDPEDSLFAGKLVNTLLGAQHASGGWRYGPKSPNDGEGGKPGVADVSATQYALLGLQSALRLGIPVRQEAFTKAANFLFSQQEADGPTVIRITQRPKHADAGGPKDAEDAGDYGKDKVRGFCYMKNDAEAPKRQASGGMTCAGIVGLMVCRNALIDDASVKKDEKAKRLAQLEQGIYDGLAWLDAHWSTESNPGTGAGGMGRGGTGGGSFEHGYYLYALERVGIMADLREIGPGHDWFLQGAKLWTSRMTKEEPDKGFWAISGCRAPANVQDTPYGLLFLRKTVIISYAIGEAE